jgi:hypothetical protein
LHGAGSYALLAAPHQVPVLKDATTPQSNIHAASRAICATPHGKLWRPVKSPEIKHWCNVTLEIYKVALPEVGLVIHARGRSKSYVALQPFVTR